MAKTRRGRFEDVAGKRVQHIINKLELLGNCSNQNNYEYTVGDIKKMFIAIREQLKRTEGRFDDELNRHSKNAFKF